MAGARTCRLSLFGRQSHHIDMYASIGILLIPTSSSMMPPNLVCCEPDILPTLLLELTGMYCVCVASSAANPVERSRLF